MNFKVFEKSLKRWKKLEERGAIIHQAQMIDEQIHMRTIKIRECKKGMEDADRIHALMRGKELERLDELYSSHRRDKQMVNLCMKYIKKGPKYKFNEVPVIEEFENKPPKFVPPKEEEFIPPPPIVEAPIAEIEDIFVPEDPAQKLIAEIDSINTTVEAGGLDVIEVPVDAKAEEIKELEAKIAKIEDESEFPCPHCDRIYATQPALKRHITMRHKEV